MSVGMGLSTARHQGARSRLIISAMPGAYRDVVRLRLLGYNKAEISKLLGLTPGTVHTRYHRGLNYLREYFGSSDNNRIAEVFANLRAANHNNSHETTPSNHW